MPDPVIEVTGLRKAYGPKVAVADVSFHVADGEIFGILGPNGAGKTTTVECSEGLRVPDTGTVAVLGHDPHRDRPAVTSVLGAQLQESQLQNKITVAEALRLFASFYSRPADGAELIERLGLTEQSGTQFAKLSGGQKQRLSIALALVGDPRIVVLDELTTGLDPTARRDTWDLVEDIRAHGVTVVLVTHFMVEAERLCDRVALIDNADGQGGRIVALGTPADIAGSGDSQVITFVPSRAVNVEQLRGLPHVTTAETHGHRLAVTGSDEAITDLVTLLSGDRIVMRELRVAQATLDDAFVRITRHDHEETSR